MIEGVDLVTKSLSTKRHWLDYLRYSAHDPAQLTVGAHM